MNEADLPSADLPPAKARSTQIGTPPKLPLAIAARVAWNSIRARLTRSLVTASSVVLAVAFVLAVVGAA